MARASYEKTREIALAHYVDAIETWDELPDVKRQQLCEIQEAALRVIPIGSVIVDKQGQPVAVVMPWEATEAMCLIGDREIRRSPTRLPQTLYAYQVMRDACIAERKGEW